MHYNYLNSYLCNFLYMNYIHCMSLHIQSIQYILDKYFYKNLCIQHHMMYNQLSNLRYRRCCNHYNRCSLCSCHCMNHYMRCKRYKHYYMIHYNYPHTLRNNYLHNHLSNLNSHRYSLLYSLNMMYNLDRMCIHYMKCNLRYSHHNLYMMYTHYNHRYRYHYMMSNHHYSLLNMCLHIHHIHHNHHSLRIRRSHRSHYHKNPSNRLRSYLHSLYIRHHGRSLRHNQLYMILHMIFLLLLLYQVLRFRLLLLLL